MRGEEKRLKIIEAGAELIHAKGYHNTGLKEILDLAGVPKGSFYYFFHNKEDFGLQVIEYFSGFFSSVASKMLGSPKESVLEKLEDLFVFFEDYLVEHNYSCGCPIGNLAQELGSHSDRFAQSLEKVFLMMSGSILEFLVAAAHNGEIPEENATKEMADFILDSWEGTLLRVKVQRDIRSLVRWREYVCRTLLIAKA